MTQAETSQRIGVHCLTVTNWELEKTTPRVGDIPGIIQFLGYDPRLVPETLSAQLIWHREGQGLTQAEFARQLGVDPSTLAKWERGERVPMGKYRQIVVRYLLPD